jgi:hypothetical protein
MAQPMAGALRRRAISSTDVNKRNCGHRHRQFETLDHLLLLMRNRGCSICRHCQHWRLRRNAGLGKGKENHEE